MSTLKAINQNHTINAFATAPKSRNGRMHTPLRAAAVEDMNAAQGLFGPASPARIAHNDCLRVEIVDGGRTRTLSCLILTDLGMYVRADEQIVEKTVLRMRLAPPLSVETIEVFGEVTPVSLCAAAFGTDAGFGILFQDLSEESRNQIRNYIEWKQIEEEAWEPNPKEFAVLDPWESAVDSSDGNATGLRAESFLMRFPVTPEMEEALRVASCC